MWKIRNIFYWGSTTLVVSTRWLTAGRIWECCWISYILVQPCPFWNDCGENDKACRIIPMLTPVVMHNESNYSDGLIITSLLIKWLVKQWIFHIAYYTSAVCCTVGIFWWRKWGTKTALLVFMYSQIDNIAGAELCLGLLKLMSHSSYVSILLRLTETERFEICQCYRVILQDMLF